MRSRVYAGSQRICACSHVGGRRRREAYLLPAGSLTLLESHAWYHVSLGIAVWDSQTYQSLEDTLSCCRTAGLDLPDVVLGDLLELQAVRDFLWSHS
jgi:hypothetical protein